MNELERQARTPSTSEAQFDRLVDTHLKGPLFLMRRSLRNASRSPAA